MLPQAQPFDWRRFNRRAFAVAVLLHLLILLAALRSRVPAPVPPPPEARSDLVFIQLPKPRVRKTPEPVAAGAKLAVRPSAGLPTKKTVEHALATLPPIPIEPMFQQTAVTDPLPNLAAIDVAAASVGTGGTGAQAAGAGAAGNGNGTGLFGECADTPGRPMVATLYRLPVNTTSLAGMTKRRSIKHVCLAQLDITPRSFREGFPGIDGLIEWFGLDIRFDVNIAKAGPWDMTLVADDGAILSIDDVDVINNDGMHQPRAETAQVVLAAGVRHFRVRYFQGPRENIALMLVWKRPGDKDFGYISPRIMSRPTAL